MVIAIFAAKRAQNLRLVTPVVLDELASKTRVAEIYARDLHKFEQWLNGADKDSATMIKKTEDLLFSARVPAGQREAHFQAVVTVRKLEQASSNLAPAEARKQLLRLVRSLMPNS